MLHRLGDRWAVALYPHVDGRAHAWGDHRTTAERLAVVDLLATLHRDAGPAARAAVRRHGQAIPRHDELVATIAAGPGAGWGPGPYAEPARDLLARHGAAVLAALDRHDALAAAAAARPERWVVTHGEPHPGNTITTAAGPVLVDWDTTRLAPPERDLWSLVAGGPEAADRYAERTGTAVDPDGVALHRLAWDLTDIALYVFDFRRPHADDDDPRTAWAALRATLDPTRWRTLV